MGGVRGKAPLAVEGLLQTGHQGVEGMDQGLGLQGNLMVIDGAEIIGGAGGDFLGQAVERLHGEADAVPDHQRQYGQGGDHGRQHAPYDLLAEIAADVVTFTYLYQNRHLLMLNRVDPPGLIGDDLVGESAGDTGKVNTGGAGGADGQGRIAQPHLKDQFLFVLVGEPFRGGDDVAIDGDGGRPGQALLHQFMVAQCQQHQRRLHQLGIQQFSNFMSAVDVVGGRRKYPCSTYRTY